MQFLDGMSLFREMGVFLRGNLVVICHLDLQRMDNLVKGIQTQQCYKRPHFDCDGTQHRGGAHNGLFQTLAVRAWCACHFAAMKDVQIKSGAVSLLGPAGKANYLNGAK